MARDVLEHDDRVVHHEAGRDRERHQRQVVQAVAAQIHHAEGAGQRHRHRDARNQRRAETAQKHEHDHDHERERNAQCAFDFDQRRANGRRAVHHHVELDRRRNRRVQQRQQLAHRIDRADHVRIRLLENHQRDRRLAVERAVIAHVLDRIHHVGHVAQMHRAAVRVAHDQRRVVGRGARLVVGFDLPVPLPVADRALRAVRVARGDRGAHLIQRDAERRQLVRVELDPHGRQRAAADVDLADAADLRDALREHGGGRVVHLAARTACPT